MRTYRVTTTEVVEIQWEFIIEADSKEEAEQIVGGDWSNSLGTIISEDTKSHDTNSIEEI